MKNYEEIDKAMKDDATAERFGHFQCMNTDVLVELATGKVNAQALAAWTLAGRGVGDNGKWIGFEKAEELWKNGK